MRGAELPILLPVLLLHIRTGLHVCAPSADPALLLLTGVSWAAGFAVILGAFVIATTVFVTGSIVAGYRCVVGLRHMLCQTQCIEQYAVIACPYRGVSLSALPCCSASGTGPPAAPRSPASGVWQPPPGPTERQVGGGGGQQDLSFFRQLRVAPLCLHASPVPCILMHLRAVVARQAQVPADGRELHEVEGAMSVVPGQLKLPRWGSEAWGQRWAAEMVLPAFGGAVWPLINAAYAVVPYPRCTCAQTPLARTASFKFLEKAAVRTKPAGTKQRLVTLTEVSTGCCKCCICIICWPAGVRTTGDICCCSRGSRTMCWPALAAAGGRGQVCAAPPAHCIHSDTVLCDLRADDNDVYSAGKKKHLLGVGHSVLLECLSYEQKHSTQGVAHTYSHPAPLCRARAWTPAWAPSTWPPRLWGPSTPWQAGGAGQQAKLAGRMAGACQLDCPWHRQGIQAQKPTRLPAQHSPSHSGDWCCNL